MITLDNFFSEEIILENERAKLTSLRRQDIEELDKIAYEPQMWVWGISVLKDKKYLAQYIDTDLKERESKISYPFLVFDKKTNTVAGSTRFGSISVFNKRVEIGWTWMHPRHQGTGLNKSCKFL